MKLNNYIFFFVLVVFISCKSENKNIFENGTWIDMSYSYESKTPYWPTALGFQLDTVFEGMTEGGYYYSAFQFASAEHGGTHIDAPSHFAEGRKTVDELNINQLVGDGIVVDVIDSVKTYIDYQVQVSDFIRWEKKFGKMPDGAIVLLRTGFGKFWPDKKRYMGTNEVGPAAVALLHFPGLHPDAAKWLVENRNIKAIGLDTPSIDYGRSSTFMSHRILMEKDIPAFENVANLELLPEVGVYIIALPMKIKGGSGGPLRIVAFLPE